MTLGEVNIYSICLIQITHIGSSVNIKTNFCICNLMKKNINYIDVFKFYIIYVVTHAADDVKSSKLMSSRLHNPKK